MANIQNRLTSGIFNFFLSGCCTELFSCNCRIDFCKFFGILNVVPNRPFCKGYSLCKIADFKNRLISGIFGILRAVFFTDYSLCKMAEFENRLISGIFGILRAVFFTDYSLCKMA